MVPCGTYSRLGHNVGKKFNVFAFARSTEETSEMWTARIRGRLWKEGSRLYIEASQSRADTEASTLTSRQQYISFMGLFYCKTSLLLPERVIF
jgi:hypothetical protein